MKKASESGRFSDMFAKSIGLCDYKAVKWRLNSNPQILNHHPKIFVA